MCDRAEHQRLGLPHMLQHFPIDEEGRLRLTAADLAWLTKREGCRVETRGGSARLTTDYGLIHVDVPFVVDGEPGEDLATYGVPYPERVVGRRGVRLQPDGEAIAPGAGEDPGTAGGRLVGLDGKDAVVVDADVPRSP